jgi:hypothetical protein
VPAGAATAFKAANPLICGLFAVHSSGFAHVSACTYPQAQTLLIFPCFIMISLEKLLLMLSLFACSLSQVKPPNRDFELVQATSRSLLAGVPGGGRSTTYKLQVKIKTDKPLRFESLWVGGKRLAVRLQDAGQNGEVKFARNEVVTLLAAHFAGGPGLNGRNGRGGPEAAPRDSVPAPVAYEGAALLTYVVDGSARHFPVPHFDALPTIYGQ